MVKLFINQPNEKCSLSLHRRKAKCHTKHTRLKLKLPFYCAFSFSFEAIAPASNLFPFGPPENDAELIAEPSCNDEVICQSIRAGRFGFEFFQRRRFRLNVGIGLIVIAA